MKRVQSKVDSHLELPPPFEGDPRECPEYIAPFQGIIMDYYREYGRDFPWRETRNPYYILLSEMMLQQTQTQRVLPKYNLWIETFPTWEALAEAPLLDVLALWKGLGYNRRAKAIHTIAKRVVELGEFPKEEKELLAFPMVGPATAAAIGAFCFDQPTSYLETNIRRVLLYFFFHEDDAVHDRDLYEVLQLVIQGMNPREWYYAFMDYGVYLKGLMVNPNRRSAHYTKQSKFEGSHRQIRGALLHILIEGGGSSLEDLYGVIKRKPEDIDRAMNELVAEGFVVCDNSGSYSIS